MYIFLDESGDLGFNFATKRSSNYFVITLLVCHNRQSVLRFKSAAKHTLSKKINNKTCLYRFSNCQLGCRLQ